MIVEAMVFAASLSAVADEESPTPFVDRHGSHGANVSESAAPPPSMPPAGPGPAGVEGFRGDRRARSIGYIEWVPRTDVAGYRIEWGTSPGGPYYAVADEPIVGRELLLRGMPASEMVFVRIRAVGKNGAEGALSEPIVLPPLVD